MRYFQIGDKVKTNHGTATVVCFEGLGSKECPIHYENPTHPENINGYRVGMQLDNPELWCFDGLYFMFTGELNKIN
jgi:hypothetical protein